MGDGISRRTALGLSAGVLAGAVISGAAPTSNVTVATSPEALLSPLTVGARFARWTVAAIHPVEDGAMSVVVRAQDGHEFSLDIVARDASPLAARPPAAVGALAIHVCNSGDGWLPTAEEQGLAAMTLAQVIEANGKGEATSGLLTQAERLALFSRSGRVEQPRVDPARLSPSRIA
jgi:hypothetical protein